MRTITRYGEVLAVLLGTTDYLQHSKKHFFTEPGDSMQVGSLFFGKGSNVAPHRHKATEIPETPMEVILVLCGGGVASIYGKDGALVESFAIRTGDILIQRAGGHGFEWTSDTTILEVKLGPYLGRDYDKELI